MNAAQTALYFREWGLVRKFYLARGIDPKQVDNKRHDLHRKALGHDKSSKDFTNANLDAVLAVFRGVYDASNFDAQMALQEQPELRVTILQARIQILRLSIGLTPGRESSYVAGIARKLFGTDQLGQLNSHQLGKLEGVLMQRVRQLHSPERVAEIQQEAVEHGTKMAGIVAPAVASKNENPF